MMMGLAFRIEKSVSGNEIANFSVIALENLEWEIQLVDLFKYSNAVVTFTKHCYNGHRIARWSWKSMQSSS